MVKYIIKRLLALIPVLLAVTVLVFLMVHVMPGDPARILAGSEATDEEVENIRIANGLDKPLPEQYIIYLGKILQGDLGTSFRTKRPVAQELLIRYPNTMKLACTAIVIALIGGIGIGMLSATKRYTIFDNASMLTALVGISIPEFYLGLMMMLLFCVKLNILPISGGTGLINLILPALTLSFKPLATIARMTRSSMLEVMSQDYILAAKAQGFNRRKVVFGHALRNAMNTIVTIAGLQFGALMGGALVAEKVFGWPGLGDLLINAIRGRDFPVVQSTILAIATCYVVINLLIDILYALINPKIKLS